MKLNTIQRALALQNVRARVRRAQAERAVREQHEQGCGADATPEVPAGPTGPTALAAQDLVNRAARAEGVRPGGDRRREEWGSAAPDGDPFGWSFGPGVAKAVRRHRGQRIVDAARGKPQTVEVPAEGNVASHTNDSLRPPRFLRATDGPMDPETRRKRQILNAMAAPALAGLGGPPGSDKQAVAVGAAEQDYDPFGSVRSSDSY